MTNGVKIITDNIRGVFMQVFTDYQYCDDLLEVLITFSEKTQDKIHIICNRVDIHDSFVILVVKNIRILTLHKSRIENYASFIYGLNSLPDYAWKLRRR